MIHVLYSFITTFTFVATELKRLLSIKIFNVYESTAII